MCDNYDPSFTNDGIGTTTEDRVEALEKAVDRLESIIITLEKQLEDHFWRIMALERGDVHGY